MGFKIVCTKQVGGLNAEPPYCDYKYLSYAQAKSIIELISKREKKNGFITRLDDHICTIDNGHGVVTTYQAIEQ